MILRNLTKEKASEIIEKGKVLGSQEMGTSEFKLISTYYYFTTGS